jgi:hypothetical protein
VAEDIRTKAIIDDHPEGAVNADVTRIASENLTDPDVWMLCKLF